jgi:hypothetical protein
MVVQRPGKGRKAGGNDQKPNAKCQQMIQGPKNGWGRQMIRQRCREGEGKGERPGFKARFGGGRVSRLRGGFAGRSLRKTGLRTGRVLR